MAYGKVPPPDRIGSLDARLYPLPQRAVTEKRASVLVWPINCALKVVVPVELQNVLRESFNKELEKGITYPQRGPMSEQEFASYFMSYDLIVGLYLSSSQVASLVSSEDKEEGDTRGRTVMMPEKLSQFLNEKETDSEIQWNDYYAFSYYIKASRPSSL